MSKRVGICDPRNLLTKLVELLVTSLFAPGLLAAFLSSLSIKHREFKVMNLVLDAARQHF